MNFIQQRLQQYGALSQEGEEMAINEITQEVMLYALSMSGFFSVAAFVGGTALRILHGLDRFSEDLDFSLLQPDPAFSLDSFIKNAAVRMETYGYKLEFSASEGDPGVQRRFVRDSALKRMLALQYTKDLRKKIRIKIKVDTNPPHGAESEMEYHIFPQDFSLRIHTMESLFAGKLHALLCRPFIKGRDWYDFGWYVRRGSGANGTLLKNALHQFGPWRGESLDITTEWITQRLSERIMEHDWDAVRKDVSPLLTPEQRSTLEIWSAPLFLKKAQLVRLV
ncbi:nucleotidyl transferase AbiEii/AbiGii toxin family protein [Myxococcota bacterium]|nr:nucleotidyl transferase AbiEii/AbiGii toxin family protein [Myxococcota bacterium]MBU1534249.1 nucleotidyl transferase AbiEii/AbiGii toxin family protein [Myxococcota bacterium]